MQFVKGICCLSGLMFDSIKYQVQRLFLLKSILLWLCFELEHSTPALSSIAGVLVCGLTLFSGKGSTAV